MQLNNIAPDDIPSIEVFVKAFLSFNSADSP